MKIESILQRPAGTEVVLNGRKYNFKPLPITEDPEQPHVADVDDPESAKILLSITEGYRPYVPGAAPAETRIVAPKAYEAPAGGILSPIEIFDAREQAELEEAELMRSGDAATIAREAQEAADAHLALLNGEILEPNEEGDIIRDQPDATVSADSNADQEADEEGQGETEGEAEEAAEIDPMSKEALKALSTAELAEIYEAVMERAPAPSMTPGKLISAIIAKNQK